MTDGGDDSLGLDPTELAPLGTIVKEWTRLGCVGFGGPPTHITLLRRMCVEQRRWMDAEDFEDAIVATNLLPGPASTQLAIFCVWRLRGAVGGILGGLCFIVPGLVLILALSAFFCRAIRQPSPLVRPPVPAPRCPRSPSTRHGAHSGESHPHGIAACADHSLGALRTARGNCGSIVGPALGRGADRVWVLRSHHPFAGANPDHWPSTVVSSCRPCPHGNGWRPRCTGLGRTEDRCVVLWRRVRHRPTHGA